MPEPVHDEQIELERRMCCGPVMLSMVMSGDAAAMGPHAVTVYIVIKNYVTYSDSIEPPKMTLLAEKSGMSVATVKKCITVLEEFGYLSKRKIGRQKIYRLEWKLA